MTSHIVLGYSSGPGDAGTFAAAAVAGSKGEARPGGPLPGLPDTFPAGTGQRINNPVPVRDAFDEPALFEDIEMVGEFWS